MDGGGVRKARRAMVRPTRELAETIQEQNVKMLATDPGIGEAMAERIVAKLRRKVGIFALIVKGVEGAAQALAPHPLPHYAQELATALHLFYDNCRVLPSEREPLDPELTRARLLLVAAAKVVLANTLHLIGVSAPEQM